MCELLTLIFKSKFLTFTKIYCMKYQEFANKRVSSAQAVMFTIDKLNLHPIPSFDIFFMILLI